jgi:hypothetical protein
MVKIRLVVMPINPDKPVLQAAVGSILQFLPARVDQYRLLSVAIRARSLCLVVDNPLCGYERPV